MEKADGEGLRVRVARRAKRLFGPTLGVFGFDSEGHQISPRTDADKDVAARVRDAGEKDDHARMAIAEAEIATERRENR